MESTCINCIWRIKLHESLHALLYVGNRPLGQEPQDFKKQIQGMKVIVLLCAVLIYTYILISVIYTV